MKNGYSVSEAAERLGYSKNSIYGFLNDGLIKSTRIGNGKFRISEAEIEKFEVNKSDLMEEKEITKTKTKKEISGGLDLPTSILLPKPRPGSSLADLSGEKPLHTLKLWFAERVGVLKLFDWLTSLTAIVLGISMILYSNQLSVLNLGTLSFWMNPIRLGLILGGLGLILSFMIQEEISRYVNLKNYFHFFLMATFLGFAVVLYVGKDIDGFLIYGLFALIILTHSLTELKTSTLYMFYLFGLIVCNFIIYSYFPTIAESSLVVSALKMMFSGFEWVLSLLIFIYIVVGLFGYFFNKVFLKKVLFSYGVILCMLAVFYGVESYWAKAFTILITGMVGLMMPFWDVYKAKTETNRPLAYKMFGSLLATFVFTMVLIAVVQGALISSAYQGLEDKAIYVKAEYTAAVDNIEIGAKNLVNNDSFTSAYTKGQYSSLVDQIKYFSLARTDVGIVAVINLKGNIVAANPSSDTVASANVSGEDYFTSVVKTGSVYISKHLESLAKGIDNLVIVAVPFTAGKSVLSGILVVGLSGVNISSDLERIAQRSLQQSIYMVGEDGYILIHPEPAYLNTIALETDGIYDVWKNEKKRSLGYDWNRNNSLFTAVKVPKYGLTAVASQPLREVLGISGSWLVWFLIMQSAVVVMILVTNFYYRAPDIKKE